MNFIFKNKNFGKVLLIISAVFFLWISSFGLLYDMNQMGVDGSKNSCIFSVSSDSCAMNISEHITLWQGMTLSLPQNIIGIVGALLLLVTLALVSTFWRNSLYLFSPHIFSRFKLYIKQHPQMKLFNYLKEIFSSGILNKKIYKLATI